MLKLFAFNINLLGKGFGINFSFFFTIWKNYEKIQNSAKSISPLKQQIPDAKCGKIWIENNYNSVRNVLFNAGNC